MSAVQRVSAPTRDILVTRSLDGDRTFAGFGAAATTEYADCFLSADKIPLDLVKVGPEYCFMHLLRLGGWWEAGGFCMCGRRLTASWLPTSCRWIVLEANSDCSGYSGVHLHTRWLAGHKCGY